MTGLFTPPTDIAAVTRALSASVNDLSAAVEVFDNKLPAETEIKRGTINFGVDSGTANAYVVALPYTPSGYVSGLEVGFLPLATNTGAATINVNGLGVKSLKRADGSALSAGDITVGIPVLAKYSSVTGYMHMSGSSAVDAAAAAASASAAASSASAASTSASSAESSATSASASAASAAASTVFVQAGTGAVTRTNQNKMRDVLSVNDYGAVGDGVTDDTAAFQAAIDYLNSIGGGTVHFSGRHLIDSNLTIKDYVALQGPLALPDEILPATAADYDGKIGVLVVNSSATITTNDGASVGNCVILRKGLNLPFADATAATTGVAAFAGTAITVGGAGSYFHHLLVLGFNKAIYSSGYERIRCEYVQGDCTNGIEIVSCYDITYINKCHFWPFTTVHQSWTTNALLRRTGTAYLFSSVSDWTKVTNCFSYGYYRGFNASSVDSMTFLSCSADNTSTAGVGDHTGSIGFNVEGTSKDTRMTNCQSAAQENAYVINTTAGYHTRMIGCDSWAASSNGVVLSAGDVSILGGVQRNTVNGILVNNTATRGVIDGVRFESCSNKPIGFGAVNSTIWIGPNNDYSTLAAGDTPATVSANYPIQSIASADPLLLPVNGDVFEVTGTTNFGTLSGGWRGRRATLIFTGSLTVNDGGSSMKLAGNFTTSADDTITLVHNGVAWYEVSRSTN